MVSKVLVIGLDGATLDLIEPWAQQGKLPNLSRIMHEGMFARLHSTLPPYTAQAWTTMVTGVNAGQHRIYDFWEREFSTYGFNLTNARSRAAPAIWNILSDAGLRSIVVNVPMTYPPEPINGIMISGRDTPGLDSPFTYPAEIRHHLDEWSGGHYVIVPNDWRAMQQGKPAEAHAELVGEINSRFRVMKHLLSEQPWDFAMFVVGATDGAHHFFWKYFDPHHPLYDPSEASTYANVILDIYQRCDQYIGELLAIIPPETLVIIVSDHGGGAEPSLTFSINNWLAHQGWLTYANRNIPQELSTATLTRIKSFATKAIPYQTLTKLRAVWPDSIRRKTEALSLFSGINWAKTVAFSEERRGNVWINVQGREPDGIVPPGTPYEQLRDAIVSSLSSVVDPKTQKSLFTRVWRKEEVFSGPYLELIPDIVLESDPPTIFRQSPSPNTSPLRYLSKKELAKLPISGNHLMDGTLMLLGQEINDLPSKSLYAMTDVAPLILSIFNLSANRNITTGHPQENGYSEAEEKNITDRLAGLGYL